MELDFKRNLGATDRVLRVLFGILLLGLVVSGMMTDWGGVLFIVLAVSQFIEAFFGY